MVVFGSGVTTVGLDWTTFKARAVGKGLSIQYETDTVQNAYAIFALDGPIAYTCTIWQGTVPVGVVTGGYSQGTNDTDKANFEALFKPVANTPVFAGSGAIGSTSFVPNPSAGQTLLGSLQQDAAGALATRGTVLTDEGSLRDDFVGSALSSNLTGTSAFTNGSVTVIGTGSIYLSELTTDMYVKLNSDSETAYARVASVDSDTQVTLDVTYSGATSSGTTNKSSWKTQTPSGATISVSSSEVTIAPGTTNGNLAAIYHHGDYLPYTLAFRARITQRITNQTGTVGFQDSYTSPTKQAVVIFDGATNTTVKFRTSAGSAAADTQETTVTLPSGLNTSQTLGYQIDLSANMAVLSINGTVLATHANHLPAPYEALLLVASVSNAATVTATTLALDLFFFANLDQLQVTNSFTGEPARVIQRSTNSATSNVTASASDQTILAANPNRLGATLYNDSTGTLALKLGAGSSATSFTTKIGPSAYYEVPFGYTGIITGNNSNANGAHRVTELT